MTRFNDRTWHFSGLALLVIGCAPGPSVKPASSAQTLPTTIVSSGGVQDVEELLREADAALARESYADAARLYARAGANDVVGNYRRRAWIGEGEAFDLLGDSEGALRAYERAAALGPPGRETDSLLIRSTRLLTFLERYREAEARARTVALEGRAPMEQVALLAARALGALESDREQDAERDVSAARALLDPLGIEHLDKIPLDVAALSFAQGELLRRQAARVRFDPLPTDFAQALENRCSLLLQAQGFYSESMRAQSAHYSAMAGVRVAQLYQELHEELMRVPLPKAANTDQRKALVQGALRLRYSILLTKATAMLTRTLEMVERTGEGKSWAIKAREALDRLNEAKEQEEAALRTLPYSRAQLEQALQDLSQRTR